MSIERVGDIERLILSALESEQAQFPTREIIDISSSQYGAQWVPAT